MTTSPWPLLTSDPWWQNVQFPESPGAPVHPAGAPLLNGLAAIRKKLRTPAAIAARPLWAEMIFKNLVNHEDLTNAVQV